MRLTTPQLLRVDAADLDGDAEKHIARANEEYRQRLSNIRPRTDDDLRDETIHQERLKAREEAEARTAPPHR